MQMRIVEMATGVLLGLMGPPWRGEDLSAFAVFPDAHVAAAVFGFLSPFFCALVTRSMGRPEDSRWMGSDPAHFNALYWLFWYGTSAGVVLALVGLRQAPPDGFFTVCAFLAAVGLGALGSSWLIKIIGPRKPDEPASKGRWRGGHE